MKTPASFASRALLPALFAFASAHAEPVLAPLPVSAPPASPVSPAATDTSSAPLASITSALTSGMPLWQRGPVVVRTHFSYRYLSADGIEAGPGNLRNTVIQSFSPGLRVHLGSYVQAEYSPTWTYYSSKAFRDSFDQTASISGHYADEGWSVGGAQRYESAHGMLVETGRQTHQENHSTSLAAAYQFGLRTSFEASVNRSVRYANAIGDAPEWTTSDWLQYSSSEWVRYRLSPRINVAGGINFGWADVSIGDDMSFFQPQAQLAWQPTRKITLSAQGSVENRVFEGNVRGTLRSPLYSAAFSYAPMGTTRLHFDANRTVSASYFANEITRSRGWSAGLEQRLLGQFYVDASYSTRDTNFLPVRFASILRRQDRYESVRVRVSTVLLERNSISVLYHVGRNSSDLSQYDFVSHQYGLELSSRF